jgi:hypothetical protein
MRASSSPPSSKRRPLRALSHSLGVDLKKRLARRIPKSLSDFVWRRNSDSFIVSPPKCGRTWLRLMLARAASQHFAIEAPNVLDLTELSNTDSRVPRVRFTHALLDQELRWDAVTVSPATYGGKPVILLVRDPRDVTVSSYYQKTFRVGGDRGNIDSFVREETGSFCTLLQFYRAWAVARSDGFAWHLVRYEDLHANAAKQLDRILRLVGLKDVSEAVIEEAVRYAAFDNMRKMEQSGQFDGRLRPRDVDDERTYKTRKAVVGGYRTELSAATIAWMERQMAEHLPREFGYSPHS